MKFSIPDRILKRIVATLLAINLVVLLLILFNRSPNIPQGEDATLDIHAPVQIETKFPSPAPAVQASLWWDSVIANRDLWLVNRMRFRWVKQIFSWREIEARQKGEYVWDQADQVVSAAEAHGLYIIARLDREPGWLRPDGTPESVLTVPPENPQDFGDFCKTIAARYKGRAIKAYQVWNEPNLAREWGGKPPDPVSYTRLLEACYKGIKEADPDAIVISAGLAPTGTSSEEAMPDEAFFEGMYNAGASRWFDMLGVNAPGYAAPPQMSPDEVAARPDMGGQRWASFRHVEDIRRIMLKHGDGNKQIGIMEMGWTTDTVHPEYSWFAVTEQQQAEYLAGAYWWARLNWQPWIGFMTSIYIADPYWTPDDEEFWWSITAPGFPEPGLRPSFTALADLPVWDAAMYSNPGVSDTEEHPAN
jgi:hypothetical protein